MIPLPPRATQAMTLLPCTTLFRSGSKYFNAIKLTTERGPNPYMFPKTSRFTEHMQKLGVRKDDQVICYDNCGLHTAPYIWWMMKYFGMDNVRVLDGGLPQWIAMKFPTAKGKLEDDITIDNDPKHFEFTPNKIAKADFDRIRAIELYSTRKLVFDQIVDFRPYDYTEKCKAVPGDPKGRRSIESAINIPSSTLLNPDKITLRPPKELYFYLSESKLNLSKPIIGYSTTGISACLGLLALSEASADRLSLYDGSWAQYVTKPPFRPGTIPSGVGFKDLDESQKFTTEDE